MAEVQVQGLHPIELRDRNGDASQAVLEIQYRHIRVLPPINKSKQYPELLLTVIHAQERGQPKGRDKVDWKLITNLPITSRKEKSAQEVKLTLSNLGNRRERLRSCQPLFTVATLSDYI